MTTRKELVTQQIIDGNYFINDYTVNAIIDVLKSLSPGVDSFVIDNDLGVNILEDSIEIVKFDSKDEAYHSLVEIKVIIH